MRRHTCGAAVGIALALAALRPRVCAAQAPAGAASVRRVEVVIAAPPDAAAALEAVARDLLDRLPVRVDVRRAEQIDPLAIVDAREREAAAPTAAAERGPVARAWIDWVRPGEAAVLYIADEPWDRVLLRRVPRPPGREEVAREEIGHILEATVEALLDGARIGVERATLRAQTLPPPAGPPRARRATAPPAPPVVAATLRVMYEAQGYSAAVPVVHGPLLAFALSGRIGAYRVGGWLSAQYRAPIVYAVDPVGVRLDSGAARALATLERLVSPRVAVGLALGGGVDIARIEPLAGRDPSGVHTTPVAVGVEPVATALALLEVRVLPALGLLLAAGCDVVPSATQYTFDDNGATQAVLAPWWVRPTVMLGVALP